MANYFFCLDGDVGSIATLAWVCRAFINRAIIGATQNSDIFFLNLIKFRLRRIIVNSSTITIIARVIGLLIEAKSY